MQTSNFLYFLYRNTFFRLENLKILRLINCAIQEFNPNELPSSLESLDLSYNKLETFHLTNSLINLNSLDLSRNKFKSFILDLRDLLPNIKDVSLESNRLMEFQVIDNNFNHTLEKLILDSNKIRNVNAYEWILKSRTITNTSCKGNFPICDCSINDTLDKFKKENIVDSCIILLPEDVEVKIGDFLKWMCPHNPNCTFLNGLYFFKQTNKQKFKLTALLF